MKVFPADDPLLTVFFLSFLPFFFCLLVYVSGLSAWLILTAGSRYQKTETALKSTAEKTTSFLGGIGTGLSAKLGAVKNSDTFRSMEERVGSVYSNVKVCLLFSLPILISWINQFFLFVCLFAIC